MSSNKLSVFEDQNPLMDPTLYFLTASLLCNLSCISEYITNLVYNILFFSSGQHVFIVAISRADPRCGKTRMMPPEETATTKVLKRSALSSASGATTTQHSNYW